MRFRCLFLAAALSACGAAPDPNSQDCLLAISSHELAMLTEYMHDLAGNISNQPALKLARKEAVDACGEQHVLDREAALIDDLRQGSTSGRD